MLPSSKSISRRGAPSSAESPTLWRERSKRSGKGGCPIPWRSVSLTALSALAFASCGGEDQQAERRTVTGPTIPAAVAERLASRSARVATLLDAGDACAAKQEAGALRADLTASIETIPEIYLEDLSGLVNEIDAQIPACPVVQPPPVETNGEDKDEDEDEDEDERKGKDKEKEKENKDKDKKKNKDEEDD
jgi:hypothetical protein